MRHGTLRGPLRENRGKILVVTGLEATEREDVLDSLKVRTGIIRALAEAGREAVPFDVTPEHFDDLPALAREILALEPACVFNLFEGFSADSGVEVPFCEMLEAIGVPFTGNPHAALAACLDKEKAKRTLAFAGVPVPRGFCIRGEWRGPVPSLAYPVFCKPCCEDGSVGIGDDAIASSPEELVRTLDRLLPAFPRGVIVEEFLPGTEYNAGFLGNGGRSGFSLLAVSSIDYGRYDGLPPFLGYDAKWNAACPAYQVIVPDIEQDIPADVRRRVKRIATAAGKALGCSGYFRVDLRERNGELYVLDVNPNPDLYPESGFARQGRHAGYTYPEIVSEIVRLAEARTGRRESDARADRRGMPRHGEAQLGLPEF